MNGHYLIIVNDENVDHSELYSQRKSRRIDHAPNSAPFSCITNAVCISFITIMSNIVVFSFTEYVRFYNFFLDYDSFIAFVLLIANNCAICGWCRITYTCDANTWLAAHPSIDVSSSKINVRNWKPGSNKYWNKQLLRLHSTRMSDAFYVIKIHSMYTI
jgi:hypothetical protein